MSTEMVVERPSKTGGKRSAKQSHDKLFKRCASDITFAKELVSDTFPELSEQYDLNTLRVDPTEHPFRLANLIHSDIVYQIQKKDTGSVGLIYILWEHQSSPDEAMIFRMLEYKLQVMKRHSLNAGKSNKNNRLKERGLPFFIPPVYAAVYYHGKTQPYPYPIELANYFENKNEGLQALSGFSLRNVVATPDEELLENKNLALLDMALKHIRDSDFLPTLDKLKVFLGEANESSLSLTAMAVDYIITEGNFPGGLSPEEILAYISARSDTKGKAMENIWRREGLEKGRQEGIQTGIQKGKQEMLERLRKLGVPAELIAQVEQ